MKKSYAVIGLGKFGSYIAKGLAVEGENVIVCDNTKENFRDLQDSIEDLYVLDSTDKLALEEAGVIELDMVIVSIGENVEASILTLMALRELGNKTIIAKAISPIHGQILLKIGADRVIYPEKEVANRLLAELISNKAEVSIISEDLKMCKMIAGNTFGKRTIEEIQKGNLEVKGQIPTEGEIKVVGIKSEDNWKLSFNLNDEVCNEDFLVFVGNNAKIDFYVKLKSLNN
ncbi:TrkA family potassium uptake protein [Helicobacter sp. 11S02596-1]|uniref:potassium channel family protein n=1 Tax=Helicobacter sp. 11S02596-1 TaxID=1476194 RepID=UPI000BA7B31A|nr:TrkA family potassium uptake protein [Helicobacter sp. 11S02596-1]PAF42437.1 hypothetical protein BJI48_06400 [Helicobacter sp. 11S02596-1]